MDPKKELLEFAESCSAVSLGDLLLAKLNRSANASGEFQSQIEVIFREVMRLMELADRWAQSEAESRYVNYIRESETLRTEQLLKTLEVTKNLLSDKVS